MTIEDCEQTWDSHLNTNTHITYTSIKKTIPFLAFESSSSTTKQIDKKKENEKKIPPNGNFCCFEVDNDVYPKIHIHTLTHNW